MSRWVDLDDIPGLEQVTAELRRVQEARDKDPAYREALLKRSAEALNAGRITQIEADSIRRDLDLMHPGIVADAWVKKLVLNTKTLGAFPRRERPIDRTPILTYVSENPRRLIPILREMARFGHDETKTLQAVADLAAGAGVPDEIAEPILIEGLAQIRIARRKGTGRAS
jgi:hypothetical protein